MWAAKNFQKKQRHRTMNNFDFDFGFSSEEFQEKSSERSYAYAQFLNASSDKYGLAITSANAALAEFEFGDGWEAVEHTFEDGTEETLFITKQPSLLILNRSKPLMTNGEQTLPYDKTQIEEGNYKAFSYVICLLLNKENKPISTLPFRIKCAGYAGTTFLKNYAYYNNENSFTKQFFSTYKALTNDPADQKNAIFYAHAIYQPRLTREKVTSSKNNQSSFAVVTNSFTRPTKENFSQLIIKNNSELSNKIKEFVTKFNELLEESHDHG